MCPLGIILSTYCCNLSVVLTLQLSLLHLHFPLLRNRVKSVFLLKLEFPVKLLKLSHSLVSWPAGISTHPELDQEGMLTKFTAHLHYLEVKHKHALSTVAMLTGNNICDMCQRSHCHKPEQHDWFLGKNFYMASDWKCFWDDAVEEKYSEGFISTT